MRAHILVGAALAAFASPAAAQSMNAEAFHRQATALQKKGAMAVFSMSKIKALAAEGRAASLKARETRLAAVAAGKAPRYCPPEGPQKMDSSEFMSLLSAIPAQQRASIDMTEAVIRMLARKYPCRA
ncbi:MAG: hypothetical protein H0W39_02130 [Sphingomonas sp.]|nr:hypothetical protein [Sphingomonas sp.]